MQMDEKQNEQLWITADMIQNRGNLMPYSKIKNSFQKVKII